MIEGSSRLVSSSSMSLLSTIVTLDKGESAYVNEMSVLSIARQVKSSSKFTAHIIRPDRHYTFRSFNMRDLALRPVRQKR